MGERVVILKVGWMFAISERVRKSDAGHGGARITCYVFELLVALDV